MTAWRVDPATGERMFLIDILKKSWMITVETFSSFRRNNDLDAASSLAFSAMLAIIPALFLLTALLGMAIGSSQEAFRKVQAMATQVIPSYSQEIVKEVQYITKHIGTFGALNFLVFLLAVMPLVSDLRSALGTVFRSRGGRPFLLEKLIDLALTVVFLLGITAIAVAGVALSIAEKWLNLSGLPPYLGGFVQYLFIAAAFFLLYLAFSRGHRPETLAAGALAGAGLWYLMGPLFYRFLAFNPGYGLAFGSFKSLFVVIIWIYYSLVVFLLGAEIAAALERRETVFLKRLMAGKKDLPAAVAERFITRYAPGEAIFTEGDAGDQMFSVLKGAIAIRKGERELFRIGAGQYFGVVSFLLATPRIAAAVAVEDVELVMVTRQNITNLMNESPEFILSMLRETALRLRETNKLFE
jgi:YihY family inner membrane protein